ncbi:MAG: GrpB family protein [Patescibacteria group bacterium]
MKIDKEKYKFRSYDPKFKKLFAVEKKRLEKILDFPALIEHFGSTSVPGLGGKGIIDIIISVPKGKLIKSKKILEKNDYKFSETGGDEERFFFAKKYQYGGKTRRVHLHLTFRNSRGHEQAIMVRDLLINDLQVRKDYVKLKKEACKLCHGDGKIYRDYKNPFLWDLVKGKK